MGIVIRKVEPRVDCEPDSSGMSPRLDLCQEALDRMPARNMMKDYNLPRQFVGIAWNVTTQLFDQCIIDVNMTSQSTGRLPMKWFYVWAAGVEIQTLCIQHGLSGSMSHLDENDQVTISIRA